GVSDIALLDAARPLTLDSDRPGEWLCIHLPRRTLVAHLGFEPQPATLAPTGTLAGRLLVQLMREAAQQGDSPLVQNDPYLQLTLYDMLGSLFAGPNLPPVSAHTHKLFVRACDIIRSTFTDADLNPAAVAAELGVSLRYLQKLFTARGS